MRANAQITEVLKKTQLILVIIIEVYLAKCQRVIKINMVYHISQG